MLQCPQMLLSESQTNFFFCAFRQLSGKKTKWWRNQRRNDKSQRKKPALLCEFATIYYKNLYVLHCCQQIENCRSICVCVWVWVFACVFKCFTLCMYLTGIMECVQWIWCCVFLASTSFFSLVFSPLLQYIQHISFLHQTNGAISRLIQFIFSFASDSLMDAMLGENHSHPFR